MTDRLAVIKQRVIQDAVRTVNRWPLWRKEELRIYLDGPSKERAKNDR